MGEPEECSEVLSGLGVVLAKLLVLGLVLVNVGRRCLKAVGEGRRREVRSKRRAAAKRRRARALKRSPAARGPESGGS